MSRWFRRRRGARALYGGSPLRRAEWGMAGRYRRRVQRAVAAGIIAGVLGAGAGAWFLFIRDGGSPPSIGKPHRPRCPSARLPGHLGRLAWVDAGKLQLLDLDTCRRTTLVRRGASRPVRFGPDGKWIAFGSRSVVSVTGRPLIGLAGRSDWEWSPVEKELARARVDGQLILTDLDGRDQLLTDGASSPIAFSPDGQMVAFSRSNRLLAYSLRTARSTTLFVGPPKDLVDIAGWTPDGDWVLFWGHLPGHHAAPLNAAPIGGGGYHNVFDPVMPYRDFLSWCGGTMVFSGGGASSVSEGQQLLTSAPPDWHPHNLSADFRSSWFWPACSPDGRWIAATVTPNSRELPPGEGRRSVWVVSIDGTRRKRLAGGPGDAYEYPVWSSGGRLVMVVHRDRDPKSPGELQIVRIDPKTGTVLGTTGPIAELPHSYGRRGHLIWSSTFDWFQHRAGG
ncbi:MAG: WD40 repeat domain-containing protein [Actinomycetota bacterium]